MKRILRLSALAIASMGVLAACGNGGGSTDDSAADSGEKTITVMASGVKDGSQGVFLESFKELVEKQYPDYTVETTLLPDDQYYTALKSKLIHRAISGSVFSPTEKSQRKFR